MSAVTLIGPTPPPWGGVSVHIARLRTRLEQCGRPVTTLVSGRQRHTDRPDEVYVGNSLLKTYLATRSRARGIVHVHHSISPLALVSGAAARTAGRPFVLTLHGVPASVLWRRPGIDLSWRLALRLADLTIAVNSHVASAVERFVPGNRLRVIPAYLPPAEAELVDPGPSFERWREGFAANTPLVTAAIFRLLPPILGRRDIYGLAALADLASLLAHEQSPPFALAVLLALPPEGPEEHDFLEVQATRLRTILGPRFGLFVGDRAPPVIARSNLFLRPTLTDGDSVAVREAIDLGVPVIASDIAPRPPGVFTYPCGDTRELAGLAASVLFSGVRVSAAESGTQDGRPAVLAELLALYERLLPG